MTPAKGPWKYASSLKFTAFCITRTHSLVVSQHPSWPSYCEWIVPGTIKETEL